MTREEKMAIAKQIAECEKKLHAATNQAEFDKAMTTMSAIADQITSMDDMAEIDGMVQSLLNS